MKSYIATVALAALALIALVPTSSLIRFIQATPHGTAAHTHTSARNQRSPADRAPHNSIMHNHLSRKVFDRACAASKDTIEEIVVCLTNNEVLTKSVKGDTAKLCYKETFNTEFDSKDVMKHKELICNNRDKFEMMTSCVYKKTADMMSSKELEKLTDALVDVGMCIINALDG